MQITFFFYAKNAHFAFAQTQYFANLYITGIIFFCVAFFFSSTNLHAVSSSFPSYEKMVLNFAVFVLEPKQKNCMQKFEITKKVAPPSKKNETCCILNDAVNCGNKALFSWIFGNKLLFSIGVVIVSIYAKLLPKIIHAQTLSTSTYKPFDFFFIIKPFIFLPLVHRVQSFIWLYVHVFAVHTYKYGSFLTRARTHSLSLSRFGYCISLIAIAI